MLMFLRTFIVQPLSRAARRIKIPFSLFFDARFKKGSHSANSFLLLKAVPKLVHGVRSWLHFSIILVGTGTFLFGIKMFVGRLSGMPAFFAPYLQWNLVTAEGIKKRDGISTRDNIEILYPLFHRFRFPQSLRNFPVLLQRHPISLSSREEVFRV